MKKILSIILGLLLAIIGLIAVLFLTLNIFKSPKTLPQIAELTNYYNESYPIILQNIKNQVGHERLQVIVEEVVTKDRVTNDITAVIKEHNQIKDEIGNNIKRDLLLAFKNNLHNEYEEESLNDLTSLVSDSYKNSLFPKEEYDTVYKVINKIPFINIIFIGSLLLYLILSFIILLNKGYKIVALSNYILGFILASIFMFTHLGRIFSNFYYTNLYWTIFIKKTIFFLINAFGIASIVFIIIGLLVQIIGKKMNK